MIRYQRLSHEPTRTKGWARKLELRRARDPGDLHDRRPRKTRAREPSHQTKIRRRPIVATVARERARAGRATPSDSATMVVGCSTVIASGTLFAGGPSYDGRVGLLCEES